ncbi:glutamate 5-kinase [Ruficoccus amylovorans]|uniref:Glutamate 5-kinase n=1 Tax=Ruficoccus amylovorans TaxID=1804625 RepID=A0A842HKS5_9BACT|nr:glutamate 5-kinase [Ruficoccus amylovorans]MBC2596274.1 glutamate 5-kinase [Ruficoccus amylovorans]
MHFLENARRVVIKLGTGVLTSGSGDLNTDVVEGIAREIAALKQRGLQVVLVSSGAVGLGRGQLGLKQRPKKLSSLQKCAAVGQSILTELWRHAFEPHGIIVGQLLLTREDVRSRKRHLAIRDLFEEMLTEGIVPIVNENDTVSAAEIKFGDNDVLSALVASMTKAQLLVILSTAPGLVDMKGSGEIVPVVESITAQIEAMAGGSGTVVGTGGMITKIQAARLAMRSGCGAFIGSGANPAIISDLFAGHATGTIFIPSRLPLGSRKRWLAWFEEPRGRLTVDAGAARALREKGSSLLAKGVTAAEGNFKRGDVVSVFGPGGEAVARGMAGFRIEELIQILGKDSDQIHTLHPDRKHVEVIHRDELVLIGK